MQILQSRCPTFPKPKLTCPHHQQGSEGYSVLPLHPGEENFDAQHPNSNFLCSFDQVKDPLHCIRANSAHWFQVNSIRDPTVRPCEMVEPSPTRLMRPTSRGFLPTTMAFQVADDQAGAVAVRKFVRGKYLPLSTVAQSVSRLVRRC